MNNNHFENNTSENMNYKKRFDMGGKKTVYTGASPPEGTVYKKSMFSDIPFERLDRFVEDIV